MITNNKGRFNMLLRVSIFLLLLAVMKRNTAQAAENSDFHIVNGVLVEYTGEDFEIVIPDTVKSIGETVFYRGWAWRIDYYCI